MKKRNVILGLVLTLVFLGNMLTVSAASVSNVGDWLYKDFEAFESIAKTSGTNVTRVTDDTYNGSAGALKVSVTSDNGSPEFYMNCKANTRYRINFKIKVLQDMKLDKIKFIFFANQRGTTTLKNTQITNTNIAFKTNEWVDYSTTYYCTGQAGGVDIEEYNKVQFRLGDGKVAGSVSTNSIEYIIDDFSIMPIAEDALNIVKNGDFDASSNSTIASWNKSNVTATAEQDGANSFKYVKVTPTATNGTFWQNIAFEKGKTYNISFYAKADSASAAIGKKVVLYVDLSACTDANGNKQASGNYIALQDSVNKNMTDSWVKYTMTYTHNLDTSVYVKGSPKIYTAIGDRSSTMVSYFDEFVITEANAKLTANASPIFSDLGTVKANVVGVEGNEDVAILALYDGETFIGADVVELSGDGIVSLSASGNASSSQFLLWKDSTICPMTNVIECK